VIPQPRHPVLRFLTAALVLIQLLAGGMAATAHTSALAGSVASLTAGDDQSATTIHDELRCPLCQLAGTHATTIPAAAILLDAVVAVEAVPAAPTGLVPDQLRTRPASRAPPALLS
jgi:hypothetical protein